jgi:hypothetical protein
VLGQHLGGATTPRGVIEMNDVPALDFCDLLDKPGRVLLVKAVVSTGSA